MYPTPPPSQPLRAMTDLGNLLKNKINLPFFDCLPLMPHCDISISSRPSTIFWGSSVIHPVHRNRRLLPPPHIGAHQAVRGRCTLLSSITTTGSQLARPGYTAPSAVSILGSPTTQEQIQRQGGCQAINYFQLVHLSNPPSAKARSYPYATRKSPQRKPCGTRRLL